MNLNKFVHKYDDDITADMQERMDELVGLNEHRRDATTKNAKLGDPTIVGTTLWHEEIRDKVQSA